MRECWLCFIRPTHYHCLHSCYPPVVATEECGDERGLHHELPPKLQEMFQNIRSCLGVKNQENTGYQTEMCLASPFLQNEDLYSSFISFVSLNWIPPITFYQQSGTTVTPVKGLARSPRTGSPIPSLGHTPHASPSSRDLELHSLRNQASPFLLFLFLCFWWSWNITTKDYCGIHLISKVSGRNSSKTVKLKRKKNKQVTIFLEVTCTHRWTHTYPLPPTYTHKELTGCNLFQVQEIQDKLNGDIISSTEYQQLFYEKVKLEEMLGLVCASFLRSQVSNIMQHKFWK